MPDCTLVPGIIGVKDVKDRHDCAKAINESEFFGQMSLNLVTNLRFTKVKLKPETPKNAYLPCLLIIEYLFILHLILRV